MDKFEQWFINQDFYTNMRFIHGDALFIKDGDIYRVLPVQMTWVAWQSRQAEVDLLQLELSRAKQVYDNVIEMELKKSRGKDKRIEKCLGLIESLYGEGFNQRSNANIHISQIVELSKALRGEHE